MRDETMRTTDIPAVPRPRGGGSGGGPAASDHTESIAGRYDLAASSVTLCARPASPPAVPAPSVVNVLATGLGFDGRVNVRGSQGVRVTAGPPPGLPVESDSTNGVEVVVGPTGNLTLQRGLLPTDQKVEMTPAGIKSTPARRP
jgi:hypothetical protein